MTAATATGAAPVGTSRPSLGPQPFTGTLALLRLTLRRERIPLIAWILAISLTAIATASTFAELYPDAMGREQFATGIASNPALIVLAGTLPSSSIGGLTVWRLGVMGGVLVGLMAMFTVIRRTRADEETGRAELLASTVVGRAAPLASALIAAVGASVLIGVLVTGGMIAQDEPTTGSVGFGAALAGAGILFAAVAAIAAQLVETARAAMGLTGAVLAASFALRAVGDVTTGAGWLTWISPLGWIEKVQAYGTNDLWVLLLFLAGAAVAVAAAGHLLVRRDVGLALWPARLGPATGGLHSPLGLAIRLHRGTLIGWTVGLAVMGALVGAIVDGVGDLFADNAEIMAILEKMGGEGAMIDTMLAAMVSMIGLLVAIYTVSAALRPGGEESVGRAEVVLAGAVGRPRWLAGHLLFVVLGPTLLVLVAGALAGLAHGLRSGDLGGALSDTLLAALCQLPAAWLLGSIAVLLFGLFPAARSGAWAVLAAAILISMLGPSLQLPQWFLNISPFGHVGQYPSTPVPWGSLALLTLIAAAVMTAGVVAFRRRNLYTT